MRVMHNVVRRSAATLAGNNVTKLGLVLLPTDITGPAEAAAVASAFPSLVVQSTNFKFPPQVEQLTQSTYDFAFQHLPDSLDLLRPADSFNCIGISCTSFSFAVGPSRIAPIVNAYFPNAHVLNMADSLNKAANTIGLRRPHVLTPYTTELNDILKPRLANAGFDVQRFNGMRMHRSATGVVW